MISEKQSDLIYRPDKWTANTEIDFGGGLYGQRFTGTITRNVDTDLYLTLLNGSVSHIIESGGWWNKGTGDDFPTTSMFYSEYCQSCIYREGQKIMFYSKSHDSRTNSAYDIWVKYTKTT